MNGKYKILIIFLLCFIIIGSWCDTSEIDSEEQLIIGGRTYSVSRTQEQITFYKSTFESLEGIEQLEKLKELIIMRNTVPLKDASAISKLAELTELSIEGGRGEFKVKDIIGASKLNSLFISNEGTVDLEGIENLLELKDVNIDFSIPVNYESLTKLKKLERLAFNMPEQNTNLQFLLDIATLESLGLYANKLRDDFDDITAYFDIDASFLRELRNLKEIIFMGFHIKNFNTLSELPNLNAIVISEATTDDIDYSLFRDDVSIVDYYDH